MLTTLRDALNRLIEYFKNMEKARRNRFIILVSIAVLLVLSVSIYLGQTQYAVLYSDMRAEDAGAVIARLNEMGIKSKAQGTDTILVDKSVADQVRMQLAADGLPKSGVNFDIYQNAMSLGSTDRDKEIFFQFQTEERLRLAINTLEKVSDCSVLINFAQKNLFVLPKDKTEASAIVILSLKNDTELSDWEVRAIYEVVSKAVQGLDINEIRITDTKMRLYEVKEDSDPAINMGTQLALQQEVQDRLQKQVLNLLTSIFGEGKVRAAVNVVLNFDEESVQSKEFEAPVAGSDEGLVVSMKQLQEIIRNGSDGEVAGFDPNGAGSQYQELQNYEDAVYSQISTEANYEINEVHKQIERQKGRIERLSVAIVLDSSDEEMEDYTENVRNLVVNAIGVNESSVSVERFPLSATGAVDGMNPEEVMAMQEAMRRSARIAEYIRLGIIVGTIIAALLIVFGIIKTLRRPKSSAEGTREGVDLVADEELIPTTEEALAFLDKEDTNLVALEDYIEKSPGSVAQLLRNWLSDEGR